MAYLRDESTASYEKLIPAESISEDGSYQTTRHIARTSRWPFIHGVLVVLYTVGVALSLWSIGWTGNLEKHWLYSPALDSIENETVIFQNELTNNNKFRGKPRPELDAAWEGLLKYTNVRITADDLKKIDRNSVQLSDGSGNYMAGLDVHHQLHCLKMVYRALHPEYYHLPKAHIEEHIDHCLDSLRQFLMCKADVSIVTYDWLDNHRRPFPNFNVQHECRSFDAVNDWARERSLDIFDNSSLVHPSFGLSYPLDNLGQWIHGGVGTADPLEGKVITPPLE